jgi:hypothetical protein
VNVGGRHANTATPPSRRRTLVIGIAIAVAAVLAIAGGAFAYSSLTGAKSNDPKSDQAQKATVISTDGATVNGALNGPLQIKANNVHVVDATVRSKGDWAIEVLDGVRGTVIEKTEVYCESPQTDGIVYGNYTAKQVKVHGCRTGFQFSAAAPVRVNDSTWTDKPFNADFAFSEPGKKHATGLNGLVAGPVSWPTQVAKPWPGPTNTGVPKGTKLTAYTGAMDITQPDTVIEGKQINGCLGIKATNVTIKRSKIVCNHDGMIIRVYDDLPNGASVVIEDTDIDGQGIGLGIGFGNFTLRRVNMHNLNEGVRVSDKAVIEDCWIHDLIYRNEQDHQDILQTTGGVDMIVRHNTLEAFNAAANNPFNASFQLGSETAPSVTNLLVENNIMTGGNYTVNFRPDMKAVNVVFRNNIFVRNARYGASAREDLPGVSFDRSNVWLDNGKAVILPDKP